MCRNSIKETSILIIEDEVILALGLQETLKNFGYRVLGIETTLAGTIQQLNKSLPNLAIVDIKL